MNWSCALNAMYRPLGDQAIEIEMCGLIAATAPPPAVVTSLAASVAGSTIAMRLPSDTTRRPLGVQDKMSVAVIDVSTGPSGPSSASVSCSLGMYDRYRPSGDQAARDDYFYASAADIGHTQLHLHAPFVSLAEPVVRDAR
jgi:hypothetical protein